ncbi:MAG: hypothetical protein HYS70_02300 [Nitrospinae bacterium]|nr:hypothetical protein [Nitrospinota bacterium]
MAARDTDSLWVLLPTGQQSSGAWIDDTLKERVREKGLAGKIPLAGRFPRQRVEVIRDTDPAAINELFYRRGWTDGLPIIPPTLGRVEEMLRFTDLPRQAVIGELDPLKGQATVEKIAANAVMAGCRPEYLPILLAAVELLVDPQFNLRGVQTTDENVAPLLILNGPIARQLEINAGFGALGPGWQANATLGRALRLILNNIGGGWPGAVSFAGIGQPGRYTMCLAENELQSPWPPLHVELGHDPQTSTVTLMRAETAINVTGGLAEVASVMGSAASQFTLLHRGKVAVVLAPYVAQKLSAEGWGKAEVRRYLHAQGRVPAPALERSWLFSRVYGRKDWPDWVRQAAEHGSVPAVKDPEDITLIVAGGDIPIPQNVYFPSWGFPPCRLTREIQLPRNWESYKEAT